MPGFTKFLFNGQISLPLDPKRKELERELQWVNAELRRLRCPSKEEPQSRIVSSRETPVLQPCERDPSPPQDLRTQTQSSVVKILTWSMVTTLFLSLVGVFVLTLLSKDVPDILTVGVSSPMGYFGGMMSAYFGIQNAQGAP